MDTGKIKYRSCWKTVPFLRLFLPLLAGLLLDFYFSPARDCLLIDIFFLCSVLILCNRISLLSKFRLIYLYGIIVQISFFLFGNILMCLSKDKPLIESGYDAGNNKNYLLIQILSDPVQKKSSYKCLARINGLVKNHDGYYQDEKLLIYFNKDRNPLPINSHSWIITDKN